MLSRVRRQRTVRTVLTGAVLWVLSGGLPLDLELEALLAPEAVGNAILLRESGLVALLGQLFI